MNISSSDTTTSSRVNSSIATVLVIFGILLFFIRNKINKILINGSAQMKKATNDLLYEIDFFSLAILSYVIPHIFKQYTFPAFILAFAKFDLDFLKAIYKADNIIEFEGLENNIRPRQGTIWSRIYNWFHPFRFIIIKLYKSRKDSGSRSSTNNQSEESQSINDQPEEKLIMKDVPYENYESTKAIPLNKN